MASTFTSENKIYLDYNASTPLREEVIEVMKFYYANDFGNASSIHSFGRNGLKAVDQSRAQIADLMGAQSGEIVFTGSGTEADNLALKGIMDKTAGGHIITTAIEHTAVLETCKILKDKGHELTILKVDKYGMVNPNDLEEAIKENTKIVSIIFANNEVGTIQPIKELAAICNAHKIPFHTDAVQAFGKLGIDVNELGIDLLSISAHKIYGPKGVGALFIRQGTKIHSIIHGGSHERKMRAGTLNVPGIVGFAEAARLIYADYETEFKRISNLKMRMVNKIKDTIEDTWINGHPDQCIYNTINIGFKGVQGESLIISLDLEGIAVSVGSACASGLIEPSHVLTAMGLNSKDALSSARLSLGKYNNEEQIDTFTDILCLCIKRLRKNG